MEGIRSNFFYITDVIKCPIPTITADDNGTYVKLYYQVGDEIKGVLKENENFTIMLNSLIIHVKGNMFHLITSFC